MSDSPLRDQRVFASRLGFRVAALLLPAAMLALWLGWGLRHERLQAFAWSDARAPVSYLGLFFTLWFCGRLWAVALRPPVFIVTSEVLRIEQGKQTRLLRWSDLRGFAVRSGGRLVLFVQNGSCLTFRLLPQQLLPMVAALTSCLQKQPELKFDGVRSPGAWFDLLGLLLLAFIGRGHAALDHPYGMLTWGVGAAVVFLLMRRQAEQRALGSLVDSFSIYFIMLGLGPAFLAQSGPTSTWWSVLCGLLMALMTGSGPYVFGFVRPRMISTEDHVD